MAAPDESMYLEWLNVITNSRLIFNTLDELEDYLDNHNIRTNGVKRCYRNKQLARATFYDLYMYVEKATNSVLDLETTMKQYKKALRNKITSNIDFLNIAGDGKCSLSFNISQGGALLNRKFVSQSQNSSLNDAVYQAMLQVSSFKSPPSSYKNETLKLTVRISGGNFEVSLE